MYQRKTTVAYFPYQILSFWTLNMPRMNGFDFLEEYKKLEEKLKSSIRMVVLTTSLNPEERTRAMQYHEIKEFLNKPLTL